MDIFSLSTEALRQKLRHRQVRVDTLVKRRRGGPLVYRDHSDDDSLFVLKRYRSFTDHQPSQSRERSTQTQGHPFETASERKRRCSHSRNNVDWGITVKIPRLTATDIKRQPREHARKTKIESGSKAALQEGEDRRFAERLQAEEDDVLMFANGQWMKTRPGSQYRPVELDRTPSFSRSSRIKNSIQAEARAGNRTFERNRRYDQKHDAAIAHQLAKEEVQAQDKPFCEAAPRTRDCAVCGDTTLVIKLPSLSSCSHEAEVCHDCCISWIMSQLEANGWQDVKCPGTNCKINLTYEGIKAYSSKKVFERYGKFMARQVLSSDPNFWWCRAEGCLSGQIYDVEEVGNVFVCVECHAKFCTVHVGAYHDNETCEEYEYRTSGQKKREASKKEDEASERAVRRIAKRCPRETCQVPIQKNKGCNHMTFWKCRQEFCWKCMRTDWTVCRHA